MSCTIMYQPYAMSYCSEKPKLFKFPHVPSPPDSLHSDASSYSSPGPSSGGAASSSSAASATSSSSASHSHSRSHNLSTASQQSQSRRPLTPCSSTVTLVGGVAGSSGGSGGSGGSASSASHSRASATVTSSHSHSHSQSSNNDDVTNHQQQSQSPARASASATTATHLSNDNAIGGNSHRVHYLSANSVLHLHYNDDVTRVIDDHFSRALSAAAYSGEKPSKCTPMSTRNFPPSFWNSNYTPSKPLASYSAASAAEFYGAAVDYGSSLAHHHQADPWHYPLSTHQSYHHRSTDIPYPAMPSSSRFNAAQYGSFLLAGAAAGSGAGRFPGMPSSSQCGVGVKGDSGPWPGSRYHPESLSDLHLADYTAVAAAHYSNMTAGLDSTVVPESSKDLYWF